MNTVKLIATGGRIFKRNPQTAGAGAAYYEVVALTCVARLSETVGLLRFPCRKRRCVVA